MPCVTIATNVTIATTTIILYSNVSGINFKDKKAEMNTAINGMKTWLLDFLFMVNPPKTKILKCTIQGYKYVVSQLYLQRNIVINKIMI